MTDLKKILAAGAIAGFLGFGGMSLASAQEDPTTSTTTPTEDDSSTTAPTDDGTTTAPADGEDCPHDDANADASGSSTTTTDDAAVSS